MTTIYQIVTSTRVAKEERNELYQIQNEYGISIPLFVMCICLEIAKKLGSGIKKTCRNHCGTAFIIREALNIYAPFERVRTFKTELFIINVAMEMPYADLQRKLSDVGILNVAKLIRAIIRTVIKYPEVAATCKVGGLLIRKNTSPYRIYSYENKPLNMNIRVTPVLMDKITSISQRTGITKNHLITSVLKALCDIEFNNGSDFVHNADVMQAYILHSTIRNICPNNEFKMVNVYIGDVKYSVQILTLIEKYGVPGKQELVSRAIRFIDESANGGIQLINDKIDTDEDHNDTMLIRNAYRKEVAYATARY